MKPHAVDALCEVVRNPAIFQCDLLELPAVRQLAADKQFGGLFKVGACVGGEGCWFRV